MNKAVDFPEDSDNLKKLAKQIQEEINKKFNDNPNHIVFLKGGLIGHIIPIKDKEDN